MAWVLLLSLKSFFPGASLSEEEELSEDEESLLETDVLESLEDDDEEDEDDESLSLSLSLLSSSLEEDEDEELPLSFFFLSNPRGNTTTHFAFLGGCLLFAIAFLGRSFFVIDFAFLIT